MYIPYGIFGPYLAQLWSNGLIEVNNSRTKVSNNVFVEGA
jgi:hypothetical protein